MTESTIAPVEPRLLLPLFGVADQHLRQIREALRVEITHRDGEIRVAGDQDRVSQATEVLERLKAKVERCGVIVADDVVQALALVTDEDHDGGRHAPIDILHVGRQVRPRTPGQSRYLKAIREHALTFAIGPAGTGKTYLAVALAVEALKRHDVRKIVLVRPAVEAGESLGFLPGDLLAKINPYLRPLLDALNEMIQYDQVKRLMEQDVIEVIPLAYMRGRTLNEAFIILDEAQNTTIAQMKMFLTRMGGDSKIVVAGDTTQVDLPPNSRSGLTDAITRLKHIEGIGLAQLTKSDIVRHPLVQQIVQAYDDSKNIKARRRN